jgi:hypothetical protein
MLVRSRYALAGLGYARNVGAKVVERVSLCVCEKMRVCGERDRRICVPKNARRCAYVDAADKECCRGAVSGVVKPRRRDMP